MLTYLFDVLTSVRVRAQNVVDIKKMLVFCIFSGKSIAVPENSCTFASEKIKRRCETLSSSFTYTRITMGFR